MRANAFEGFLSEKPRCRVMHIVTVCKKNQVEWVGWKHFSLDIHTPIPVQDFGDLQGSRGGTDTLRDRVGRYFSLYAL